MALAGKHAVIMVLFYRLILRRKKREKKSKYVDDRRTGWWLSGCGNSGDRYGLFVGDAEGFFN